MLLLLLLLLHYGAFLLVLLSELAEIAQEERLLPQPRSTSAPPCPFSCWYTPSPTAAGPMPAT